MSPRVRGVRQRDESRLRNFRRDPRRIGQILADTWREPQGAAFTIAIAGFVTLFLPALVYVFPIVIGILLMIHLPEKRHRHLPMRLPMAAGIVDYNDPKPQHAGFNTSRGMVHIGTSKDDEGEELWQSRTDETAHGLVLGTTGAGKTVNLVGETANYLALGAGVVYVDAKAAPSLFWDVGALAFRVGREDDLQVINYMTGNRTVSGASASRTSNTTNPFVAGSADSCVQMLSSLIKEPDGGNAVFGERALAMVSALLYGLVAFRDGGHCDIGVATIRNHLPIDAFEQLAFDPRIEYRPVAAEAMRSYLRSLPGYRPPAERVQKDPRGAVMRGPDGNPLIEGHGEQVHNQHGFAQMYFTRAMSSLTDTYGHIYAGSLPEVDFTDTVRRRRILVVMLPALEKSPAELSNLGKINLASLRDAISTGMGSSLEGQRTDVLDNLPTDSPFASKIVLDEYGFMAVDGFSVVAAQARSLGFSVTWAGQDWAGIKRGSEKEAEQIWSNATLKKFGRLEDPEGFNKLQTQAGEAMIVQSRGFSTDANSLSGYRETGDLGLEKKQRVDFVDLQQQVEGESHIFWRGQLIRANNFAAIMPSLKAIQINRYLRVGERELALADAPVPAPTPKQDEGRGGRGGPPAAPTRTDAPAAPRRPPPPVAEAPDAIERPARPMGRAGRLSQAGARDALAPPTADSVAPGIVRDSLDQLNAMEASLDAFDAVPPTPREAPRPAAPVDDSEISLESLMGLPVWDAPIASDASAPAATNASHEPMRAYELEDMPDVIDLRTLVGEGSSGEAMLNEHVHAALEAYPDKDLLAATGQLSPEEIAAELDRKMLFLLEGTHDDASDHPFGGSL